MLNRTRVGSGLDTSRVAEAVSRPGIDPRIWKSLAVAVSDSVVDPNGEGVFVDIMLMPTEQMGTARIGAEYAGNGWGLYAPIYQDDELEVSIPSGHQAEGYVVSKRLWSAADPPPGAVGRNPKDLILVGQPDSNIRIILQGGGKLNLGSESPTDAVLLGTTFRQQQAQLDSSLASQFEALATALTALGTASTGPLSPLAVGFGDAATAALDLQSAIQAFESGDPNDQNYLSDTAFVAVKNDG